MGAGGGGEQEQANADSAGCRQTEVGGVTVGIRSSEKEGRDEGGVGEENPAELRGL